MLYVLLALVFLVLRFNLLPFFDYISLSHLQLVTFPITILALLCCTKFLAVPRAIPLIAGSVGLVAVWINVSVFTNGKLSYHVARLSEDHFEAESRILREDLNKKYGRTDTVHAYRYWQTVPSRDAADKAIASNSEIKALIWGDANGLRASFAGPASVTLSEILDTSHTNGLLGFELFKRVPVVGLPRMPKRASNEFIARLFAGYMPLYQGGTMTRATVNHAAEAELLRAANILSPFRLSEHRGFAWWVLGNYYLGQAIESQEAGYLSCASSAYRFAASFVHRDHNPELFAAIHNNKAILLLVKKFLFGKKVAFNSIRNSFLYARSAFVIEGMYAASKDSFDPLVRNMLRFESLKDNNRDERSNKEKKRKQKRKKLKK